jgi:hypothetical protein
VPLTPARRSRLVLALSLSGGVLSLGGAARASDDIAQCVKSAEEAQSLRSAHQLRAARTRLLECAQTTCPVVVRSDCAGWLSEVDQLLPSVVIEARDAAGADLVNVRVWVDDALLTDHLDGLSVPVDPGIRQFRFESAGAPPVMQQLVIREGEKGRTISVVLQPATALAPTPPVAISAPTSGRASPSPLAYVFGGVGVAALGSFAYFGLTGRAEASDLADGCGKNKMCREDQVSPVRTKLVLADVSLGVGLLSLGAGAYFVFWDKRAAKDKSPQASLAVSPAPGGVSFSGQF